MFHLSLHEPSDGSLIRRGESRPGEDVKAAILRAYAEATGDPAMMGDPEITQAHGDRGAVTFRLTLIRGVAPGPARGSDRRSLVVVVERRDDEPP